MRDINGKELREGQKVRILAPGEFAVSEPEGTLEVGAVGEVDFVDEQEQEISVRSIEDPQRWDYYEGRHVEIIEG